MMSAERQATLDESVLVSIREVEADGAPGLLASLVAVFREDATERLAHLRAAVENGDAIGTRRAAHSLKGMCSTMGAAAMTDLSLQLEQSNAPSEAQFVLVRELEAEFGRVQAALTSALAVDTPTA
jgi:HPt (histidine-containing phosphotransfer) domain-containing protein